MNNILKSSSKKVVFPLMMASAFWTGIPQTAYADALEIQTVMQTITVKGTVVDATGEPVIGASVLMKGTTMGTITDIDGNFTLSNVKPGILVVSYIGYKANEVNVNGSAPVKIVLTEDSELLDEVVVVGYGMQKKATMTGSVTVVNDKMLESKGTMSSPVQALQGQVPGVIITRSSTAPGDESWNMSLRGAVSKNTYGAQNETYIEGWEKKGIKPIDIQKVVQNVSGWLCKTKRLRGFNLQLHLGAF